MRDTDASVPAPFRIPVMTVIRYSDDIFSSPKRKSAVECYILHKISKKAAFQTCVCNVDKQLNYCVNEGN